MPYREWIWNVWEQVRAAGIDLQRVGNDCTLICCCNEAEVVSRLVLKEEMSFELLLKNQMNKNRDGGDVNLSISERSGCCLQCLWKLQFAAVIWLSLAVGMNWQRLQGLRSWDGCREECEHQFAGKVLPLLQGEIDFTSAEVGSKRKEWRGLGRVRWWRSWVRWNELLGGVAAAVAMLQMIQDNGVCWLNGLCSCSEWNWKCCWLESV